MLAERIKIIRDTFAKEHDTDASAASDRFIDAYNQWAASTATHPESDEKNASVIAASTMWKLSLYENDVSRDAIDKVISQAKEAGYEVSEPDKSGILDINSKELHDVWRSAHTYVPT